MTNSSISLPCELQLPNVLFTTQHRFDDGYADDMHCGDLSEKVLRQHYLLGSVSESFDPWTGEKRRYPFGTHALARPAIIKERVNYQDVSRLLFDEMRKHSRVASFFGHRALFLRLVNHLQNGNGRPFSDSLLNFAYANLIRNDRSKRSSLRQIKRGLIKSIDWDNSYHPDNTKSIMDKFIHNSYLPKFDRWIDIVNGLGISIHDVHATKITLMSLRISGDKFAAKVHFKGQDHFGLDDRDMMNPRYHNMPIFRIWFLLQRWEKMGFKPFMVNMEATSEIHGDKNDK